MSSSNLLLLAITSVLVACNQLGVDPAMLPYMLALSAISIGLALLAMRKSHGSSATQQTPSDSDDIRRCVAPRDRRA